MLLQEQLKLTDQAVGTSQLANVTEMFGALKPMLCTPLIRENLELVEFNIRPGAPIKHAQLLYATLAHVRPRFLYISLRNSHSSFRTNPALMKHLIKWSLRRLRTGPTGKRVWFAVCPQPLAHTRFTGWARC